MLKKLLSVLTIFLLCYQPQVNAQTFNEPLDYMNFISSSLEKINIELWDYTAAVAHSRRARKIEHRRKDLLKALTAAQDKICSVKAFAGGKRYRDSTCAYIEISINLLNNNYAKIVDMEEIAEQSYDNMEAYMTAMERADEVLKAAATAMNDEQKSFADAHKINLIIKEDDKAIKLKAAGKVFKHYNRVYLIFFKCYKEEAFMLEAYKNSDIQNLKEHRDSLKSYTEKALLTIKTVKAFKDDATLKIACEKMLMFYQKEGKTANDLVKSLVKKSKLDKAKKALDENGKDEESVNNYNKIVNEYNELNNTLNPKIENQNKERTDLTNSWNKTIKTFLDDNVPNKND